MSNVDLENNTFVPVPGATATSTKVTMEMIVGSVEQDVDGNTSVNYFVKFSTDNGHHILYPWVGLKSTVQSWALIEEEERKKYCK
jgi:hypothetical protein